MSKPSLKKTEIQREIAPSPLSREAQILKGGDFDSSLLEVFIGKREATRDEKLRLEAVSARLKERIYPEIVYLLTHVNIEKPEEAKKVFEDIIKHRNDLVRVLKRYVSYEVAALDYLQYIRNILKRPSIIESDQYNDCVYHAVVDETTQAFDKHLLDADIDAEIERTQRFQTCFIGKEHSSSLGLRGVRFLLKHRDFLSTQLRVFLRLLNDYDIRILVPFVTTEHDMLRVREFLKSIIEQSGELKEKQETIKVGAMIQTPLSVFRIDPILDTCDFVSIGTNDLQQFITAADRESLLVSDYYSEGTENVVATISKVVAACRKRNMDCYVCGQIAGKTEHLKSLLDGRFDIIQRVARADSIDKGENIHVPEEFYGMQYKKSRCKMKGGCYK